ncbi:glycosyl hydrolase family 65 protein [Brevundimonas sp.]|uniref:glycosyl hydrolase family 65 protein n=1 Tax=Brevundimonas sp. TaxID=1871086 RepID=UPI002D1BD3F1|nr:glycosyl hydrolase family 65 protein [Brevundimonas sp.]HWQ86823.1 glycosyl hydrolase family 65 protein [Brevundimonas sp.]
MRGYPHHRLFEPPRASEMRLTAFGYDPLREVNRQSRFFIGNGFLGVRGDRVFSDRAVFQSLPDAYVAGLFGQAEPGSEIANLIPAPDWRRMRLTTSTGPVVQTPPEAQRSRLDLDYARGLLLSDTFYEEGPFALRLRLLQLASHDCRALALQVACLDVLRGDAFLALDAAPPQTGVALDPQPGAPGFSVWRTRGSGIHLSLGVRSNVTIDGEARPSTGAPERQSWNWTASPGQRIVIARLVGAGRARQAADAEAMARQALAGPAASAWPTVLDRHVSAWRKRWRASAVRVTGDSDAQAALNYATYHLNSAPNPEDPAVSIGARGLTGHGYGGHVFWDTETLLLPYYCATWPEAARTLLSYRGRTLDAARAKAERLGYRGALYAWESADTGAESTPHETLAPDRRVRRVLCGEQEHHISADVALGVWRYWRWTGDDAFMLEIGAEILLETARFWSSRARLEADGGSHIRGVIGPDEYHEGVDDNAFTNQMARWNIGRGLAIARWMAEAAPGCWRRLRRRLSLGADELKHWRGVRRTLVSGFDPRTLLYEQFAGYDGLEDIDLAAYEGRSVPMDLILGQDRTQRSQVIKQADVVALAAFLPELVPEATAAANLRRYAPRCGHGSSLSAPTHGLVAARLGQTDAALDYFRRAAALDLNDAAIGLSEGVHMAALGGLWQIAVLGFAGVTAGRTLAFRPRPPEAWSRLRFPLMWRNRRMTVDISATDREIRISQTSGPASAIRIDGRRHILSRGRPIVARFGAADNTPPGGGI